MSLICSPNFQFTFSQFDKVTYFTGSYRLTPQRTECKHVLKDSAFNSLQDRICLRNSLGGGEGSKPILSHSSITLCKRECLCQKWTSQRISLQILVRPQLNPHVGLLFKETHLTHRISPEKGCLVDFKK